MNYYLNAFNEMLRKRQENQMGGGNERAPTAFDSMSNAQKADYYSNNPTMAAITQGLQKGFGMTSYGMLQNALVPDFVREQGMVARGIDPGIGIQGQGTTGQTGLYGDQFAGETAPKSRGMFESFLNDVLPSSSVSLGPPAPVETRTPTLNPDAVAAMTGYGDGMGGGGGGSYGGVGGAGFGGNSQAFNQGGMVNAQHLMGRAPAPDDGYGALQGGEYVITKAAVEKYGKRMMDAINNGTFR
jgi:hypothetical protein